MTTQYTPILKLALPVTGELSGTWGTVVNDNITSMVEQAVAGLSTINTWTANAHTLTTADGTSSEARCAMLVLATGAGGTALTAAGEVICPAASKLYVVKNGSAYAVTVKTSAGTGVAIPAGDTAFVFCDGTNVNACVTTIVNGHISGNLTVDGNTTLGDATSDTITATARFNTDLLPSTDNARDLGSTANSWRTLYCETSVIAANITISGNTISSTDTNGNITLAPNGTGDVQLDADTIRVGDSGANVTITSNGAGDLILNTNSGTNSGSITIEDGANGNIALAPNGTGQVTISTTLDLTTLEVTNIKAKDGTAAMSIADSTGVVSITANPILSGGTANGVVYLNASKVATSGSGFTYNGSTTLSLSNSGNATYYCQSASGSIAKLDLTQSGVSSYTISTGSADALIFARDGTERMRLTSTGTLNIVGAGTAGSTQAISFNGSTPVDTLVTTSTGDVGLGTNIPTQRLDVRGSIYVERSTNPTNGIVAALTNQTTSSNNGCKVSFDVYNIGSAAVGVPTDNAGLAFYTNGVTSEKMRLDSSGNLGLGVTPSSWSDFTGFQVGGLGAANIGGLSNNVFFASNAYYGSGQFRYAAAASTVATIYRQTVGQHIWINAAAGTAGNVITPIQAMTLDASGNLLVGQTGTGLQNSNSFDLSKLYGVAYINHSNSAASGAQYALFGYNGSNIGSIDQNSTTGISLTSAAQLVFSAGGQTERARITSGGDLAVGTTTVNIGSYGKAISLAATASAYAGVEISGTTGGALEFQTSQSTRQVQLLGNSSGFIVNVNGGSGLAERARITSGGYFKASNNGAYDGVSSAYHELYQSADNRAVIIANVNASATTDGVVFVRADRNTTNNTFYALSYYNAGAAAFKFRVADSGDVTNTNGTYGTISDQKMKTDIVDAGSQWADIKALRFRKFKMKDDPSGLVQLGVVAQEVELTSPGLVDEHQDRDAEGNDLGTTTKSVKTSVLLMKAAVALQEAMARIETLEAKIAALEAA